MNSRERIEKLIYSIAVADGLGPTHTDDWRELDQLLSDAETIIKGFTKIRAIQYPEGTHQWILRAAQAGYGEK